MTNKDYNERLHYSEIAKKVKRNHFKMERNDAIKKIAELRFKDKITGLSETEIIECNDLMNKAIGNFKRSTRELIEEVKELNMIINEIVNRRK